jgi:hypothetical protein
MTWLKGEPKLSDVLTEPVVQLLKRRDQVDPANLHAFLRRVGTALGDAHQGTAAPFTRGGDPQTATPPR